MVDIDELLNNEEDIVSFIKDAINDKDSDTKYIIHVIELASRALHHIRKDK